MKFNSTNVLELDPVNLFECRRSERARTHPFTKRVHLLECARTASIDRTPLSVPEPPSYDRTPLSVPEPHPSSVPEPPSYEENFLS